MGGGEVGVPQNIMRAFCAVIWPDHFKFASYGPVRLVGPWPYRILRRKMALLGF